MKRDLESEKTRAQYSALSAKLFITSALADALESGATNTSDRRKRHKAYGYDCPICGEPITEPQTTDHTDEGLAHAKCTQ